MDTVERTVTTYETHDGKRPFESWLDDLKDRRGRAAILARLARLELGNFGDCKSIGDGVSELRIPCGPGYRAYFGIDGPTLVVLLCGGDKKTQKKDIDLAKTYWKEYQDAH